MRTGRLHIRVDADLLRDIKRYSRVKRKTLTDLVEEHFRFLLTTEKVCTLLEDTDESR